jgi:hypothetical protein
MDSAVLIVMALLYAAAVAIVGLGHLVSGHRWVGAVLVLAGGYLFASMLADVMGSEGLPSSSPFHMAANAASFCALAWGAVIRHRESGRVPSAHVLTSAVSSVVFWNSLFDWSNWRESTGVLVGVLVAAAFWLIVGRRLSRTRSDRSGVPEPSIHMQRQHKRILVSVGSAAVIAAVSVGWYALPGSTPYFWGHRRHFDRVVGFISTQALPPNKMVLFTDANPEPTQGGPKWDLSGQISALRTDDGRLFVMILTRDRHHGGMYGYLFSGTAPRKELGPDSWDGTLASFSAPGDREWFVSKRLSDQWWSVYNDLD